MKTIFTFCLLLLCLPASAQRSATVVRVYDGDTYQLRTTDTDTVAFSARLLYVDTPESQKWYTRDGAIQAGGKLVTDSVKLMLRGKLIKYRAYGLDRFGRTLVMVWVDGRRLDSLLLQRGYGWYIPLSVSVRVQEGERLRNGPALVRQAQSNSVGIFDRKRFPDRAITPATFRRKHNR